MADERDHYEAVEPISAESRERYRRAFNEERDSDGERVLAYFEIQLARGAAAVFGDTPAPPDLCLPVTKMFVRGQAREFAERLGLDAAQREIVSRCATLAFLRFKMELRKASSTVPVPRAELATAIEKTLASHPVVAGFAALAN
jgi:hypothetical protein